MIENIAPTITNNGGAAITIASFTENGTGTVVDIDATDGNTVPDTITYSLSGTDAGDFSIVAKPQAWLLLIPHQTLKTPKDSDTDNVYTFVVTATDDGVGTLTDTITVTVTVTNDNELATGNAGAPTVAAVANSRHTDKQLCGSGRHINRTRSRHNI